MKLLLVTPYSPAPPNSGGRMRIWQEVEYLGQRHELTLVAFYQTAQELASQDTLKPFCERHFLVERPTRPHEADLQRLRALDDLFDWYTTPDMLRVLEPLQAETFDAVILHHIFMAHYAKQFRAPVVLEEQNIESEIFRQHAQAVARGLSEHTFRQTRWMLLRQYETAAWKQFPLRVVTSEHDRQEMQRRVPNGKIIVVENGINTRDTPLLPPAATRKILFMGSLDFFPNIDALFYLRDSILPLLKLRDPNSSLVIAGRRPPDTIRALADDPQIQVIANPEDMNEIARNCAVSIVPLRMGSGTRIKILHSLALGLPVVTTTKGAEGLDVQDNLHLLIRDEPQAFADAILQVLDDEALPVRLRAAGRELVERQYDWEPLLARYDAELRAL